VPLKAADTLPVEAACPVLISREALAGCDFGSAFAFLIKTLSDF